MEVKSIKDCLNRIDDMIFDKSLKCLHKGILEDIRKHIEWKHADVVAKGDYAQEKIAYLSVLSQINHLVKRFYSNDTEDDLDEQYNILRQIFLEWYEEIERRPKVDNQQ